MRSLFDGARSYKGTLAAVPAAAALGDAAPSGLTRAAVPAAAKSELPPSPEPAAAKAPGRARVSVGLALAGAGAAAAWYTSAWAVATIGGLLAPFAAVPALALTIGWVAAGTMAGFAAFSAQTWKGFPAALKGSAYSAGGMTFRFWARFGLIFDSVLRGKTADMKAPTPVNLFKYPVIAMPFVLAGYLMSPAAFVLGAATRLIGTPFIAAFRGAREVVVGFLPWMARVFNFIGRFVVRIFPFLGGFVWGALKTAFFGAAAGAVTLAGPIARDAFSGDYKAATLPGWIGYRLTQLAALVAVAAVGAAGAVIGLLSSPVHVVMGALELAFKKSRVSGAATAFFSRWMSSVEKDGAFPVLLERGFPLLKEDLTLAARTTRVLNGAAISLLTAFALPFLSLATVVRASIAAVKGTDASRADAESRATGETGTENAAAPRAGVVLPLALGLFGAAAGVLAAGYFLIAPLALFDFGVLAAAGLLGGAAGLALSQPQALRGWFGSVRGEADRAATQSFRGWTDAGARLAAALRGEANPRAGESFPVLAPSIVLGSVAAVASALVAGVQALVAKPLGASWAGFMAVIAQFLPALKRLLEWAIEVVKNVVPFTAGFVLGSAWGALKSGWFVATNLFRPMNAIFEREDGSKPSEAQIGAGALMALTLVVPAIAVFAGGFVAGAVIGLPVALTQGLALGVRWAGTGEKSETYFRNWTRRSFPAALRGVPSVVEPALSGEGAELPIWRVYVRVASLLLSAIPSALALLAAGGAAYLRSLSDARLSESALDEAAGRAEPQAAPAPAPKAERAPAAKPPVWLAAALGLIGLGAGIYASAVFGPAALAALAGWKLWLGYAAVFAGVPLAGMSAGLAVSQPVLWTRLLPSVLDHAKGGFGRSLGYWTAAGKAAGAKPLYALAGGLLGLPWAVAGAVFGAVAAGVVAAYEGARQVVYEILPFLRAAFETLMKILRRVVPFAFGLLAGLVSGVVGSAAFGALLLGRPYFKHVVADDFKHEGALGFLGNLLLKGVALVLGVAFGLIGVVAGVLAATPYALTASVAFAFRFADIGGPAGKFFDHWTYGSLRAEMQRLNQLTDRFQFPDSAPGLGDGWIRLANVLPATIAAAFAATIAGWVGYFRSLAVAYRTAKSGQPIPEPVVDQGDARRWESTWRASRRTALKFFSWGVTGALIGAAIMFFTSWTPLGLAGWALVGALAGVGALAALTLAGAIAAAALLIWIDGQL